MEHFKRLAFCMLYLFTFIWQLSAQVKKIPQWGAVRDSVARYCQRNLRLSSFLAGIIFYTREVLLTSHYEKRLFEHAGQPCVAGADIRLLSYLKS